MRSPLSLLLLALPLVLAHSPPTVNHRELAKRAKGDIEKRTSGARWTFYAPGLGACGDYNSASDFIVALNQQTFGYSYPSPYCNKRITMSYNGKTTTAVIKDSCPGCPVGGLDLTPGLFSFFASQDLGVIYGTWNFEDGSSPGGGGGGDSGDDDQTTTKKTTTHHTTSTTKHTTTTTHTTPTTTYTPPTTTSTTKSSTTSSAHSSSSESEAASAFARPSSSSHPVPPAPSNGLAAPSGTVSPISSADPENLYAFAQAIIDLTGVVAAANAANAE